jgi:hypothetical protein
MKKVMLDFLSQSMDVISINDENEKVHFLLKIQHCPSINNSSYLMKKKKKFSVS